MARVTNYILGAGKLYFDPLDDDDQPTGELYLGNTAAVTYSYDEQREDEYSSDETTTHKTDSVVTRGDARISFTVDDMQSEIVAMSIRAEAGLLAQAASGTLTETISKARRGRWYQMGQSIANPTGVRPIKDVALRRTVPYPLNPLPPGNYVVDAEMGRVFIRETAPDMPDGADLIIAYKTVAATREVWTAKNVRLRGSLRYIADNMHGENHDHFWPLIDIGPDGDTELKGDNWLETSFAGDVIKHDDLELHYVESRADEDKFEISNPSFETGDITGWTATVGWIHAVASTNAGQQKPRTGKFFLSCGDGINVVFGQRLAVHPSKLEAIDDGMALLTGFSGYHSSIQNSGGVLEDHGRLMAIFLDEDGEEISTSYGEFSYSYEWELATLPDTPVPPGTRFVFLGADNVSDEPSINDNYWDDFSQPQIVEVEEPEA